MAAGPALLCYDGSGDARHAIAVAGELLHGGPAVLVTVWEPYKPPLHSPVSGAVALATGLVKEFDDVALDIAEKTAHGGASIAVGAGFEEPEVRVVHGKPRDAIVETAEKLGARVVVMGNRGQGGAESVLYGSVSTAVLHRCSVPVLVVRA